MKQSVAIIYFPPHPLLECRQHQAPAGAESFPWRHAPFGFDLRIQIFNQDHAAAITETVAGGWVPI